MAVECECERLGLFRATDGRCLPILSSAALVFVFAFVDVDANPQHQPIPTSSSSSPVSSSQLDEKTSSLASVAPFPHDPHALYFTRSLQPCHLSLPASSARPQRTEKSASLLFIDLSKAQLKPTPILGIKANSV